MSRNFYDAPRLNEIVEGATNFALITSDQYAQLGLTQPQATGFGALASSLETKYQASERPETRTPVSIEARNVALKLMKQNAVFLAKIITANPAVNNDQLLALGLMPRRSRGTTPAMTVRPGVAMESVIGRTVTIKVFDAANPMKRGKLKGAAAAWVYSFIGAEYPADPSLWEFQGSTSTSKFEMTFDSSVPGGTQLWIAAAWVNARQDVGPVSMPITTYLQGGGASTATDNIKIAA
jgi:hypothetical protein